MSASTSNTNYYSIPFQWPCMSKVLGGCPKSWGTDIFKNTSPFCFRSLEMLYGGMVSGRINWIKQHGWCALAVQIWICCTCSTCMTMLAACKWHIVLAGHVWICCLQCTWKHTFGDLLEYKTCVCCRNTKIKSVHGITAVVMNCIKSKLFQNAPCRDSHFVPMPIAFTHFETVSFS